MSIFSKAKQCTGSFTCRFRAALLTAAIAVVAIFFGVILFAG